MDGIGDLESICGDDSREILEVLDEPDLLAELVTVEQPEVLDGCVCVRVSVCVFDADLMKGFTSVSSALMYQAGWTTNRPFRSFLSLMGRRSQRVRGSEIRSMRGRFSYLLSMDV